MLLQKKIGVDLEDQKEVVSSIVDELLAEMPDDVEEDASLARKLVNAKKTKKKTDESNKTSPAETRERVEDKMRVVSEIDTEDDNFDPMDRERKRLCQQYRIPMKVNVRLGRLV